MSTVLDLCCMLCLSRRAVTYSRCHLLQATSLHFSAYFCRFSQLRSSSSSSIMFPSTIFVSLPSIMLFCVKIGYRMSPSMYVRGLLFTSISTSSCTSSNRLRRKLALPNNLESVCWIFPINSSKCPPHRGAFGKLNFQLMFSFVKCSYNCSH